LKEDGWLQKNIIYKTTFPNGKIYIGIDWGKDGHHINYFGSWDVEYVFDDFTEDDFRNWTLRKEILFESDDASELKEREAGFILKYESNNPSIGYNKRPKFRDGNKQSFP